MARKYTILKVLTPNLNKGFTLIELIFGLLIMTIVGGLLMNTLIEASKSFNSDKKTIDSSQNLSAILEIIGNDIKQSGEQIKESEFPAIELKQDSADRSTIIIRRALTTSMTLCEDIPTNDPTTRTTITVGDTSLVGQPNCNPIQRDTLSVPPQPLTLREASNYRCQLGDPNATYGTALDSCAIATASANNNPSLQNVLLAVYQAGRIRTFRYTGENITPALYKLQVASPNPPVLPANNNGYSAGRPIYAIEERQYTLDANNNLTVAVDGRPPVTLISGIKRFKVSARAYNVTALGVTPAFILSDKVIDPDAAGTGFTACTPADGVSMPAGAATAADPKYACNINFANPTSVNWKQIAGVRVELEAKYNAAGESATPTQASLDKLTAKAEYFPRNVLSK
jgi:prepilin-type N-terminal cleavage/methylation domain-containing protein